jgi:hypothetical protein
MKLVVMLAVVALAFSAPASADPVTIPVALAPGLKAPVSGRLIVFAQKVEPGAPPQASVDSAPFRLTDTAVAAREVESLAPGGIAIVDGEADAFPAAFSKLAPGTYRLQAVLDRNHDYNYGGRGPGDIVSPVVEARLPGPLPRLVLAEILPEPNPEQMLARLPEAERAAYRDTSAVDFVSPSLSAFWGRPIHLRGWVALPPGYRPNGPSFPTVYWTHGFGGTLASARTMAARAIARMAAGDWPAMIWVCLDESSPTGTHEFADSVNNGSWGAALTSELIPGWSAITGWMGARAAAS